MPASALTQAAKTANLTAAELLTVAATALAEGNCTCSSLPTVTCPACTAAAKLADHDQVDDLEQAVGLIQDAACSCGATLGGLLPGIVSEILDRHAENCAGEPCPVCDACRQLDQVAA